MKALILFLLPLAAVCQENVQQQNPPPNVNPQQQIQININDDEEQQQNVVNQKDWEGNDNRDDSNIGSGSNKEKPCTDCDEIKKKKKENYGNNAAGNYSGGAEKFKRKKAWRKFCYNLTHRSGKKRSKSNYSVCFNW